MKFNNKPKHLKNISTREILIAFVGVGIGLWMTLNFIDMLFFPLNLSDLELYALGIGSATVLIIILFLIDRNRENNGGRKIKKVSYS